MEFKAEYIVLFDRVQIRYYGIIIVAAMLVAAWVAARLAKRDGRDPDHVWGALTWAIIPAIVLARLWFVVFPPVSVLEQGMDLSWFMQHFFDLQNGAIAIWSGGLSIFGAVLGGFGGAYIYFRRNHLQHVALAGYRRRGAAARSGDWALGELRQSGTLRHGHEPALGYFD